MSVEYSNSTARQRTIDQIIYAARKQIASFDAVRKAQQQAWLETASPAEKRHILASEKRQQDPEYARVSAELDRIGKSIKDAVKRLWSGSECDRYDKRPWSERHAQRQEMLERLRADEREMYQRLHTIDARIQSEVNEEINTGEYA